MDSSALAIVQTGIWIVKIYFLIGLIFAVPFVIFGVQRMDPAAKGSGIFFRLVIIPGVTVFWPLLLKRLIAKQQTPIERNAHRLRAQP